MKRMLYLSGILHILILGGAILSAYIWAEPMYYTSYQVYHVNLVSLPMTAPPKIPARLQTNEPYQVVSKKEAARPDEKAAMALKRTPKRVSEKPDPGPEVPASFDTGTQGVRLDLKEFEFPYYLAAIQRKIQQNLQAPRLPGVRDLQTMVYFKIGPTGRIYDLILERSSNNPIFDLAAQRALERSDPLPPLPDGFDHEYLGVHFEFEYKQ